MAKGASHTPKTGKEGFQVQEELRGSHRLAEKPARGFSEKKLCKVVRNLTEKRGMQNRETSVFWMEKSMRVGRSPGRIGTIKKKKEAAGGKKRPTDVGVRRKKKITVTRRSENQDRGQENRRGERDRHGGKKLERPR